MEYGYPIREFQLDELERERKVAENQKKNRVLTFWTFCLLDRLGDGLSIAIKIYEMILEYLPILLINT